MPTRIGAEPKQPWREVPPVVRRRVEDLLGVQRRQLISSLTWTARRLGLPPPTWLEAVPR